ncbi:MAG: hypothetical protein C0459_12410 [Chitinophaga sp.]|jgi:hypothetical protein|nr:hypothetical protein [Chitinophaga sp.]
MKRVFIFFIFLSSLKANSQEDLRKISDSIYAEGLRLYKSEMASWYGTDIFLAKYSNRQNVGGYFSYSDGNFAKCIFFSKETYPKVIGTISFDSSYKIANAFLDLNERAFSTYEKDLYSIRSATLKIISRDTLLKQYENTSLNIIPLIVNDERKVYILTGTNENGVVIFGNDYLLSFDQSNNFIAKKRLHANIISIHVGNVKGDSTVGTMHSHLPQTGDFITATDICTLMLYEKFTAWNQHYVISKKYISIWDCKKNILAIITREAWDKINK